MPGVEQTLGEWKVRGQHNLSPCEPRAEPGGAPAESWVWVHVELTWRSAPHLLGELCRGPGAQPPGSACMTPGREDWTLMVHP